jgi:hypothetical protein
MPLASKTLNAVKKKARVTGYDVQSLNLTCKHFGGRLIATAGAWFANDVFFYGNKLFQSQFIAVISPGNKSVMTGWLWNLVNVGVSLCGYYLASFLIDNKFIGRKRLQQLGFLMDFVLFVVPGWNYSYYTTKAHIGAFQTMYFCHPSSTNLDPIVPLSSSPLRSTLHPFVPPLMASLPQPGNWEHLRQQSYLPIPIS